MSLLDDVSIVVTPNGYKAGELYAVIPVPTEGAELVDCGNFECAVPLDDWTLQANAVIAGGNLTLTSDSLNIFAKQDIGIQDGKRLKFTYEVLSDNTSGGSFKLGGLAGASIHPSSVDLDTSIGIHYITFVVPSSGSKKFLDLYLTSANTSGALVIDNVSVKEYTSADMDVTRATAATRVDENGLVNYALGVEEVTNGDFSNGSTDWTPYGSTFVVSNANPYNGNDTALFTASGVNGAKVTQSISTVVGNTYHFSCYAQYNSGDYTHIEIEGVLEYPNGLAVTNSLNSWTYLETSFTATSTTSIVAVRERGGSNNASCYLYDISIKEVNNVPRIDYTGGGCPHILAEPQRTNLITYSEDFSQWSLINSTILSGNTTSPDGTVNADRITATAIGDGAFVRNTTSTQTASTVYSFSCFVKKGNTNFVRLANRASGGVLDASAWFDIQNGVVGTVGSSLISSKIESFGNGWYKCTVISTTASSPIQLTDIAASNADGTSWNALVGDYIYYWGADLQQGSYATSYIPTSGSTVTRNQDIFTRDGIGSLINSTEGVLFLEMAALESPTTQETALSLSEGTLGANRLLIRYKTNGQIGVIIRVANTTVVDMNFSLADQSIFYKFAVKWKVNDFALWIDGTEVASDTLGSSFASDILNSIRFDQGNNANFFYGKVKQLQVYDTSLSDEQLLQLTGESGTDFYESYAEMASALTYTIQ